MASRRKFSNEYKREAVRLATQPAVTKSQVGRELGINANLLGRRELERESEDRQRRRSGVHTRVYPAEARAPVVRDVTRNGVRHRIKDQRDCDSCPGETPGKPEYLSEIDE